MPARRLRACLCRSRGQHSDRVLAVIPGEFDELVKDLRLLGSARSAGRRSSLSSSVRRVVSRLVVHACIPMSRLGPRPRKSLNEASCTHTSGRRAGSGVKRVHSALRSGSRRSDRSSAQHLGELHLAGALVREAQQLDHDLAGRARGQLLAQAIERQPVGPAREAPISVNEVEQGHRLAAQRVDDVPGVNDVAVPAVATRAASLERHQRGAAEKQLQTVVVQPHAQAMTDEPTRHGAEHLAQREAAEVTYTSVSS